MNVSHEHMTWDRLLDLAESGHDTDCSHCGAKLSWLQTLLKNERGNGTAAPAFGARPAVSIQPLVGLLSRQRHSRWAAVSSLPGRTWSHRPVRALAAAILLAFFFGAGYVQGKRGMDLGPVGQPAAVAADSALPAPPVIFYDTTRTSVWDVELVTRIDSL